MRTTAILPSLALLGLTISGLNAQNVGIGTSQPMQKLHVLSQAQEAALRIEHAGGEGSAMVQFALEGDVHFSIGVDDHDMDKLKIGRSDLDMGTMLTIQNNGYIGIGITNPTHNFHLSGDRPNDYIGLVHNTNNNGSGFGAISTNAYNALGGVTEHQAGIGVYGAHLPAAGVGWGVWGTSNSPDGIGVRGTVPTTGTWLGYGGYFAGGLAYVNGLYNLSDARMKQNVHTLQGALDKVSRLRGVEFQYNSQDFPGFVGQDTRTYLGFVAQEVEQVYPEAVAEKHLIGTDGKPAAAIGQGGAPIQTVKVVDYVSLVPVLVEAIKEQQARIEQLEAEIERLKD